MLPPVAAKYRGEPNAGALQDPATSVSGIEGRKLLLMARDPVKNVKVAASDRART